MVSASGHLDDPVYVSGHLSWLNIGVTVKLHTFSTQGKQHRVLQCYAFDSVAFIDKYQACLTVIFTAFSYLILIESLIVLAVKTALQALMEFCTQQLELAPYQVHLIPMWQMTIALIATVSQPFEPHGLTRVMSFCSLSFV